MPVTLSEDTHLVFSRENKPLPQPLIHEFISNNEEADEEQMAEYIACFRLQDQEHFSAIVFWRASLMEYAYILATFDHGGQTIDRKIIAGTKSDGDTLLTRVATIDEDCLVSIAEGIGSADGKDYDPSSSTTYQLEISPTGDILHMLDEH